MEDIEDSQPIDVGPDVLGEDTRDEDIFEDEDDNLPPSREVFRGSPEIIDRSPYGFNDYCNADYQLPERELTERPEGCDTDTDPSIPCLVHERSYDDPPVCNFGMDHCGETERMFVPELGLPSNQPRRPLGELLLERIPAAVFAEPGEEYSDRYGPNGLLERRKVLAEDTENQDQEYIYYQYDRNNTLKSWAQVIVPPDGFPRTNIHTVLDENSVMRAWVEYIDYGITETVLDESGVVLRKTCFPYGDDYYRGRRNTESTTVTWFDCRGYTTFTTMYDALPPTYDHSSYVYDAFGRLSSSNVSSSVRFTRKTLVYAKDPGVVTNPVFP